MLSVEICCFLKEGIERQCLFENVGGVELFMQYFVSLDVWNRCCLAWFYILLSLSQIRSTEMSAGETPLILDAWPMFNGRTLLSF